MDIYTRDLVRSGHATIGTPVIAGTHPSTPHSNPQTPRAKAYSYVNSAEVKNSE